MEDEKELIFIKKQKKKDLENEKKERICEKEKQKRQQEDAIKMS